MLSTINEYPISAFKINMLFHDEELNEEELKKYFEKLDPKTIELIKKEYGHDYLQTIIK